ncbi:hypothetical protein [Notoacmeibacter sp. MSK16QG-6]|uniref:hypothetical protein n=1 Tax=Notoacmeibacter sp. MSK16QG-6 TaxID=2957982 RepID=UPI00209F33EC|nr:hypothetical protein [Notoacmeibacter sp. MSK16QG-6]MCP1198788.1 hypothetical protein [Notoacmeibacter sp. MSK16QG-6]
MLLHSLTEAEGLRTSFYERARKWTMEKRRQKLRRDSISTLLNVDENILRDIVGISRDDVRRAVSAPLHIDAATTIRLLQRRRP